MMFWIIRLTGEDAGTLLPEGLEFGRRLCAGTTLSIGRQECDLCIPDMSVSRRHALVEYDTQLQCTGEELVLRDLNSKFGTLVNGRRITDLVITSKCCVQLGTCRIMIEFDLVELRYVIDDRVMEDTRSSLGALSDRDAVANWSNVNCVIVPDDILASECLADALNDELMLMTASDWARFRETNVWCKWPQSILLEPCDTLQGTSFHLDPEIWRNPDTITLLQRLIQSAGGEIATHGTRVRKASPYLLHSISISELLVRIKGGIRRSSSSHSSLMSIQVCDSCLRKRSPVEDPSVSVSPSSINYKRFSKVQTRQRIPYIISVEAMGSSGVVPAPRAQDHVAKVQKLAPSMDQKAPKFRSSLFKRLNVSS